MNNRKSPIKQQRMKNSHSIPVPNSHRVRSNSSMGSSYSRNPNSHYRHYSHTNSPTGSPPAVPLFYSTTYADPPDCSSLPKPPESWYLNSNDENQIKEEQEIHEIPKQKSPRKSYYKNNNKGFYSPFYTSKTHEKFPTPYISVKA
jgi:hypothetical protein